MDFSESVSDQSEDLFSDDDGTEDVEFMSSDARTISPPNLSQSPISFRRQQEETPGRAIVPKTPLTLAPFISKADAWTSDLETPEIKRDQLLNQHNESMLDSTLIIPSVLTPVNSDRHPDSEEINEEIVPSSQEQPRKVKRHPKRRIFHKNSTNYSALRDDDDDYDENYENNIVKKSQSCIEYSDRVPVSPVKKIRKLRELQKRLREKNNQVILKKEIFISDDEFVKEWKVLEKCDRVEAAKPKDSKSIPDHSIQDKSPLLPSKIQFKEEIDRQSTLLLAESPKVDIKSEDFASSIDLGVDEIDQEDDMFLEKTFVIEDERNKLENYAEGKDTDDENPFKGFSTDEEKNSELLLLKFERTLKLQYSTITPKKLNFSGFSFVEIEIARTISQNQEIFHNNYLDKYYGIIDTELSEESQEIYENPSPLNILPPLIVSVYSGFKTANGNKLLIVVDKIVSAQKILLNNEDITEHSIDQLLVSSNSQEFIKKLDNTENEKTEVMQLEVKVPEKIYESDGQEPEENDINDDKHIESHMRVKNTLAIEECEDKVPEVPLLIDRQENVSTIAKTFEELKKFPFSVGFQTGLGKPIEISENALSRATIIYGEESSKDFSECLNEMSNWKSKVHSVLSKKTPTNGFKSLLPKSTNLLGLNSEKFKSVINQNSNKQCVQTPVSLRAHASKESNVIQQVEKQDERPQTNAPTFQEIKTSRQDQIIGTIKIPGAVKTSKTSPSIVEMIGFKADEDWDDAEDFSEFKLPDLPRIGAGNEVAFSGFSTGTGRTVEISEEALSRGRAMYAVAHREAECDLKNMCKSKEIRNTTPLSELNLKRSAQITPVASCNSVNNENDSNLPESSSVNLQLPDSSKRNTSNDDITPLGRKRARLGGNDLQGRILFSEIEDEDREIIQSAMAVENDLVNDRILPFKNKVIEEMKTSSASLHNFDRNSGRMGRHSDSSCGPQFNRNTVERRPHSFPDFKTSSQDQETVPDDLIFDSQDFIESYTKTSGKFKQSDNATRKRNEAIENQKRVIEMKKINREKKIIGSLFQYKNEKRSEKIALQDLCYKGRPPVLRNARELANENTDSAVISINSSTAESYKFKLCEFYENLENNYIEGVSLGDGATLIPDENNLAGVNEFKRSFLASPGVDPLLLPRGWVENHYKWIIWKLASMDRSKFSKISVTRSLTPDQVLKQLKYRYDREIDNSQRSLLRKILEKDEAPSHRMILCVSRIIKSNSSDRVNFTIELTDGWYSVMATIDTALNNYIHAGKINEGMKLIIYGAQLLNLEEGCHPLEISDSVRLKIHTNSTRRARWYERLGLQRTNGPLEIKLKNIHRSGGLIGKVSAIVSRVYPIMYKETFTNGEIVLRNARSEERAQMSFLREQESRSKQLPILFRDVQPCLKIRITDGDSSGIITIWQNAEECSEMFKEGNAISIIHGNALDKRSNELQISATRWTTFDVIKVCKRKFNYPSRIFTPLSETMVSGFNPSYGEFDTVGIVVSIGPAPHGMKNFETANLAYKSELNEDSFLSILFWQGLASYGYSDIVTIGSIICCLNCEWRRNTYRSIPTAFCSERTIITRNPRQDSHLKNEFDSLKVRIGNTLDYVDDCALKIHNEVIKKSGSTPNSCSVTPNYRKCDGNSGDSTPKNHGNVSIQSRLDKLQCYGSAPKLSSIHLTGSNKVALDFRSPLTRRPKNDFAGSKT